MSMEIKVEEDILKELSLEEIIKLRDLYKQHLSHRRHVHYFLHSTVKWMQRPGSSKHVTVLSPHGNWKTGTFVVIYRCKTYEVFLSTLETPKILSDIVTNTKKIDWSRKTFVYAIHNDHKDTIKEALKSTNFHHLRDIHSHLWWMPAEDVKKLTIECPSEVFLSKLNSSHVELINTHWQHKFKGSDKFMEFILRMNGGWGVFLKNSNELVAWVMKIQMGLGMLCTVEDCRRRGYGELVSRVMLKEIAEEGIDPVAATLATNPTAQAMFEKIGLRKSYPIVYLESREQ